MLFSARTGGPPGADGNARLRLGDHCAYQRPGIATAGLGGGLPSITSADAGQLDLRRVRHVPCGCQAARAFLSIGGVER